GSGAACALGAHPGKTLGAVQYESSLLSICHFCKRLAAETGYARNCLAARVHWIEKLPFCQEGERRIAFAFPLG
ncbi:hypothetical protein, partial [Malikia spinosa]|uniref:hypothetical protein n=1 Tax=Malikia spinosa TaxID=86180 RepID=UPI0027BA8D9F